MTRRLDAGLGAGRTATGKTLTSGAFTHRAQGVDLGANNLLDFPDPAGPAPVAAPTAAQPAPVTPNSVGKTIAAKHPGVNLEVYGRPGDGRYMDLSRIEVPKELRGQGVATQIMEELIMEADNNNWPLALTPAKDFGSSVPRLKKFYARFGFVENKGRNKDYTTMQSMIRPAA